MLKFSVAFSQNKYVYTIGESGNVTCEMENIPDWNEISVSRSDGFVLFSNMRDAEPVLNGSELANETNIQEASARIVLIFDPVACSSMQDVYTCAVRTNTWFNATTDITLISNYLLPLLYTTYSNTIHKK